MKLKERKIHEEENTTVHLMLLFQTVMQLFSMVKKDMRDADQVSMNSITLPPQRELERFAKQVEDVLKENGNMKSQLEQQQERIQRLESAGHQSPLSSTGLFLNSDHVNTTP